MWSLLLLGVLLVKGQFSPFTDPTNKGKWKVFWPMTDSFSSKLLDTTKWWATNPYWLGRQPGLFKSYNVHCCRDQGYQLHLHAKKNLPPNLGDGYGNFSTSAVQSKAYRRYLYSEVNATIGGNKVSSAFWFNQRDDGDLGGTNNFWTEIDVIETSGDKRDTPPYRQEARIMHLHTHVFKLNGETNLWNLKKKCGGCKFKSGDISCQQQGFFPTGQRLKTFNLDGMTNGYHIYGLHWTASRVKMYFDRELVWDIPNYCLHQPMRLNLDRETFPDWFGIPPDGWYGYDKPFKIDYVRTWVN